MENTLAHHGIKGQKWGVRRFQNKDGTLTELGRKRLAKEASQDAKEYARAKMYYGKGAGNRRKLIKASVEQKMKDKNYKDAFDKALADQDMAKRASEARVKRKVEDTKDSTAKTARGLVNAATGNIGRASAASAAIFTAAHITGLDKKVVEAGKKQLGRLLNRKIGSALPDKKQKASEMSDADLSSKVKRLNLEKQYNKLSKTDSESSKLESSKRIVDSASSALNQLRNSNKSDSSKVRPYMSKMSNNFLQDRITRENLERQYTNMFGEKAPSTKMSKVIDGIIDYGGPALSTASSVLAIAIAVKELRK